MNNKLEALREDYNNEFPDPMTKKYGNGFALYCSNCSGEERNKRTDWWLSRFATIMDEVVESIVPEEKEVGHILECNMCSPQCGWNSAIATIKNNYKEIKQ